MAGYIVARDEWYKAKVTSRCNLLVLDEVYNSLDEAHQNIFLLSAFGELYKMRKNMSKSNVLMHVLALFRIQSPTNNNNEIWFRIGGQEVKFSFSDYTLITGLKPGLLDDYCDEIPSTKALVDKYFPEKRAVKPEELKKKFIDATDMDDKLKLGLAVVWEYVLRGISPNAAIDVGVLSIVENLDLFNKYPWGTKSYPHLLNSMMKMATSRAQTSVCNGFPLALQVWIFELCHDFPGFIDLYELSNIDSQVPKTLRMCNWKSCQNPSYEEIIHTLDITKDEVLVPLTPTEVEKQQPYVVEYERQFGADWSTSFHVVVEHVEDEGHQQQQQQLPSRQHPYPSLVVTSTSSTSTPYISAIFDLLQKMDQKIDHLRTEVTALDRKVDDLKTCLDLARQQASPPNLALTPTRDFSPTFPSFASFSRIRNANPTISTTPPTTTLISTTLPTTTTPIISTTPPTTTPIISTTLSTTPTTSPISTSLPTTTIPPISTTPPTITPISITLPTTTTPTISTTPLTTNLISTTIAMKSESVFQRKTRKRSEKLKGVMEDLEDILEEGSAFEAGKNAKDKQGKIEEVKGRKKKCLLGIETVNILESKKKRGRKASAQISSPYITPAPKPAATQKDVVNPVQERPEAQAAGNAVHERPGTTDQVTAAETQLIKRIKIEIGQQTRKSERNKAKIWKKKCKETNGMSINID